MQMIRVFLLMSFLFLASACATPQQMQDQQLTIGEAVQISKDAMGDKANKYWIEVYVNVAPWRFDEPDRNYFGEEIKETEKKLEGRKFVAVYYRIKRQKHGGSLCNFIDLNTGEVLAWTYEV